jgi:serine/threonine-protein kinase
MSSAADLTSASWAAFSRLLDEALELPAGERVGWLEGLGAEHEPLKSALRAVLVRSAGVETAQWLATLPHTAGAASLADASDLRAEALVGPYRLLREIGTGGMGAVWLAERADGTLKRQVALKLPRASWSHGLAERMVRERDILAALEHPHIARLYDAGTDAQGRPYLALEYVEGQPIDAYCRQRSLDTEARLQLLLQVAQAVAFAHSRLVVHRDLKPSNILVTADGQVRLLDFGIAKLMEGERTAETQLTQLAGRALTLDYASPEQIRGEPIGTASDVYSLGVVAYELLAGAKPYKLKRGSAAELEEAIASLDAPLASAAATDSQARKELKGDLDAILSQALKKDPDQRYATIDALARDVERHLAGQRVVARADSLAYRVSRFARRYRTPLAAAAITVAAFGLAIGVGATALVILALLLGLGAALWQTRKAAQERDRALVLAERNTAGSHFIDALLTRAVRGGPVTPLQLLERSERLVDSDVTANTAHRALVLGLLADLNSELDQPARALALLDKALEAAKRGSDPALRDSLQSRRALAIAQAGRIDEAVATTENLLARHGISPVLRSDVHRHRAKVALIARDFPAAVHHATEALRWHRSAPNLTRRSEPVLLAELAWACLRNGCVDEADRRYAESATAFEAMGLAESAPAIHHATRRAQMYEEIGDLATAIRLFEAVGAVALRAAPESPLAIELLEARARTLAQAGQMDQADATCRQGVQAARLQGDDVALYRMRMLAVDLLASRRRPADARREFQTAEAERDFELPCRGAAHEARLRALARLALAEGSADTAVGLFGEALGNRDVAARTVDALLGRAEALEAAGETERAEADARDALRIAQRLQSRGRSSHRTGLAWLAMARLHLRRGEALEAGKCARTALVQLSPHVAGRHPALTEARSIALGSAAADPSEQAG